MHQSSENKASSWWRIFINMATQFAFRAPTPLNNHCKNCGASGSGKYCPSCGESYEGSRLTPHGLLHEAFHFFTHFDKGFAYTLKQLIIAPGKMQRQYIEGVRRRYQKPFSMFFICATFAALALYWINVILVRYFHSGDAQEAAFFHEYWVVFQVCMMPVYTLIAWVVFKKSGCNYAEIGVFQLYTFSLIFLILVAVNLLRFLWPELQTRYLELPSIIIYCIITNVNFFLTSPGRVVAFKSIILIAISFVLASALQDLLVKIFA